MQLLPFIKQLYPLPRSLTGKGTYDTLVSITTEIPVVIQSLTSGTKVLDWTIPKEWNITDAYVKNSKGEKVIDFTQSNLHVVNYSIPVNTTMSLEELQKHLHTLPDTPDAIPYRTSYYDEEWGFCMAYNEYKKLAKDTYEVVIKSSLSDGKLHYGELVIPGETKKEILISTHICHPSLCNDNLSGIAVATALAKNLLAKKSRYTYRFLFVPGTIGSIAWLATHEQEAKNIRYGLVLTGLGDAGAFHYKKSRIGNAAIDIIAQDVLEKNSKNNQILEFSPFGYDERQYCSPGFNLPVGCLMRSIHGTYKQYHTSLDNIDFISEEKLQESVTVITQILHMLETSKVYKNLFPKGEPQLGKRGLYKAMAAQGKEKAEKQLAMLWLLNLSDGTHTVFDIAKRSNLKISLLEEMAELLEKNGLLKLA